MFHEALGIEAGWLRRAFIAGVVFALIIAVVGIFAPLLAPHDPLEANIRARNAPPIWYADGSSQHILGTDNIGRDLISRIMFSFRIDVYIGVLGFALGTLAAWALVILRSGKSIVPDTNALPALLSVSFLPFASLTFITGAFLFLFMVAIFGQSFLLAIALAGVFSALLPTVLIYESVRADVRRESTFRLALRCGILLAPVSFGLALLMGLFIESFASFLGLGVQPPTASLGGIIAEGRLYVMSASWIIGFPSAIMLFAVASFLAIAIPADRVIRENVDESSSLLASRLSRFIAVIVDRAILFAAVVLAIALSQLGIFVAILGWAIFLVVEGLQLFLLAKRGQTLGKRFLNIRIVRNDTGENAGFYKNVVIRHFANGFLGIIPFYRLVDYLYAIRGDRRTVHDRLAGTRVIRLFSNSTLLGSDTEEIARADMFRYGHVD